MGRAPADDEPFVISDSLRQWAKEWGIDPERYVGAFVDHWRASGWKRKGGVKIIDREAAFRNWLRREKEYGSPKAAPMPQPKQVKREPEMTPEQLAENRRRVGPLLSGLVKEFDVRKAHEKL